MLVQAYITKKEKRFYLRMLNCGGKKRMTPCDQNMLVCMDFTLKLCILTPINLSLKLSAPSISDDDAALANICEFIT